MVGGSEHAFCGHFEKAERVVVISSFELFDISTSLLARFRKTAIWTEREQRSSITLLLSAWSKQIIVQTPTFYSSEMLIGLKEVQQSAKLKRFCARTKKLLQTKGNNLFLAAVD